jgi:phosphatidylglycerophosphate synthase
MARKHNIFYIGAFVFFMLYILCDNMDGIVARERKQCSELGKVLDHFVDGTSAMTATAMIAHRIFGDSFFGLEHCLWILPITGLMIYHVHDSVVAKSAAKSAATAPPVSTEEKHLSMVGVEDATILVGFAPLIMYCFPGLLQKFQLPGLVLLVIFALLGVGGLIDDIRKNIFNTSMNDHSKYASVFVLYLVTCCSFLANHHMKYVMYVSFLCVLLALSSF